MIGASDMAFPRLNAFSFWMTAFGGLLLYFSFLGADGLYGAGNAPDVGWFRLRSPNSKTFSRGHSTDYGFCRVGLGSAASATQSNIIATIVHAAAEEWRSEMPLLACSMHNVHSVAIFGATQLMCW